MEGKSAALQNRLENGRHGHLELGCVRYGSSGTVPEQSDGSLFGVGCLEKAAKQPHGQKGIVQNVAFNWD